MRFILITFCAAILAGCNVPSPDYVGLSSDPPDEVTVDDLVGHIQCELIQAKDFDVLALQKYRAQVTLTLKVEDGAGLSPSLSFIHPFMVSGTSMTNLVGGTLSVDRQRTFTNSYTIALEKLNDPKIRKEHVCGPKGEFTLNLTGDLGIGGIIASGIDTARYQAVNASAPPPVPGQTLTVNVILNPKNPANEPPNVQILPAPPVAKPDVPLSPSFGSTTQFIVVKNVNAGPTWVLKHFKGPSGSTGMLSAGRTDTNTLVLAFSPANSPKVQPSKFMSTEAFRAVEGILQEQADAAAEARAQFQLQILTTNMILQNLTTLQPGQF